MSGIEERLARDIAAVTGGVVMTGADLELARESLDDRIDTRRRNRRRNVGVAAAALVLAGAGVAAYLTNGHDDPGGAGPVGQGKQDGLSSLSKLDREFLVGTAPTMDALTGVWRLDNGVTAYQFSEDGTVRFHDSGRLFSDAASTGTYEIDSDKQLVTITTVKSDNASCVGSRSTLLASVPEPTKIRLVVTDVEGESSACATVGFGQQTLEGLSPINDGFAEFAREAATEKGWVPLTAATLGGLYFDSQGHVLELDLDTAGAGGTAGRYYIVDDTNAVVDQGTWDAVDAKLTLTSSSQTGKCTIGDRLVLSNAEQPPADSQPGIRGTVTRNSCGGDWASPAWVAVPSTLTD